MLNKTVDFDDVVTLTRASTGTYWDKDGVLQTAAIDEPRFDHDPVTGERLALLIEYSATNEHPGGNLASLPECALASDPHMPEAVVITADADRTGLANRSFGAVYPLGTGGGSNSNMRVIYCKYNGSAKYASLRTAGEYVGLTADVEAGVVVDSDGSSFNLREMPGGWYELSFWNNSGAAAGNQWYFGFGGDYSGYDVITTDGETMLIAYPSCYDTTDTTPPSIIYTEGSAVTRSADAIDAYAAFSDRYDPSRGWLLIDYQLDTISTMPLSVQLAASRSNHNSIQIYENDIRVFDGPAFVYRNDTFLEDNGLGRHKVLFRWGAGEIEVFADGVSLGSVVATMPPADTCNFFKRKDGAALGGGYLFGFAMGTVISDEDAIDETAL